MGRPPRFGGAQAVRAVLRWLRFRRGDRKQQYKYTVCVDDNFHYMDESERYELGEFDDCEAAIAACKQIVDDFLQSNRGRQEDLYAAYSLFGEDPFIRTDDPNCHFSARDYARERVRRLTEGKR